MVLLFFDLLLISRHRERPSESTQETLLAKVCDFSDWVIVARLTSVSIAGSSSSTIVAGAVGELEECQNPGLSEGVLGLRRREGTMLEESMIGDRPRDGISTMFDGRLISKASACASFLRSLRVGFDGMLGFGFRLIDLGAVSRN